MNPWTRILGRRSVQIACAAVLIVGIASGLGLYLSSRSHQAQTAAAKHVGPAPSVAPAGTTAVATPKQAVLLTVVKTFPAAGSAGNAVDTRITLDFNLPVDPAAVNSFLAVVATGQKTPTVNGTLSQGSVPEEVLFKASGSFDTNATVQVSLRGGLKSIDGSALINAYSFSFATTASPRTVTFLSAFLQQARLINAPSGTPVNLTVQAGPGLSRNVALKTYRAGVQDLLSAFVYADDGYPDRAVDTSAMTPVDNGGTTMTASGARTGVVQDSAAVTVSQPDGLYVVVAADAAGQYGAVWINFSRYAILERQDDHRVVVAGEDLGTGEATAQFAITFYNLLNGIHVKAAGTFSGVTEFPAKYPSGFDLAVAQTGGETVIVPMAAPETNGDTRLVGDLSQQLKIFVTTDRLAYHKGDTVRFGGAVRVSNDQAYAVATGVKVDLWTPITAVTLATPTVAADGTFSGSFAIPAAAFNEDGTDASFTFFAGAHGAVSSSIYSFNSPATVVALGTNNVTTSIGVVLDKSSYVASDTPVASITGPAGATVSLTIYASQHPVQPSELDSFAGTSSWGDVVQPALSVKLDAGGHASYSFKANIAHRAADMNVTVAVTNGPNSALAVAARTATVYQAAAEVFLLAGRTQYSEGDTAMVPFVVETRDGSRVPNAGMSYEIDTTDYSGTSAITTVVASGTTTADANGMGIVRATLATHVSPVTVRVEGKDGAGNVFEDDLELGINIPSIGSFSGDTNARLDILADKIAYATGDAAVLTVTSPAAETALLSLERGRVHEYRLVQLAKGDNQLHVNVTADLAPGFNAVISYFQGGEYTSQTFPISLNNSARVLKVKVTPDQATYAKGQTAHVTITVTDASGAAVAASALADGYDARMSAFKVVDRDSMIAAFLTPNPLTTNGSSSLLGIGIWGGMCGGGYVGPSPDPIFAGQSVVWSPDVAIDASGHATVDVPISGPVRLAVFVATRDSSFGQAEIDLGT